MAEAGLEDEVDVVVGTLGKALGSYGAYVCCDAAMAEYLVNTARTLIFSTALSPPAVAAAMAALELLREQPRRVEKLQRNAAVLREALPSRACPPAARPRSCRWSWVTPGQPCRPASARSSAAYSPRPSARRRCRRAPRACDWR